MNRRGFLQLLSAVAATAAIPVPKFVLEEPLVVVPSMPIALGAIREVGYYDIECDQYIVRLDAYNGLDQFGVDFRVPVLLNGMRDQYLRTRKIAEECLYNMLIEEKWNAGSMIALPSPSGYVEPEWMRAAA